jgi:predicted nicotinamide N-methyase
LHTVVWKVTPLFASWISSPTNFLFTNNLLSSTSTILELGAGVSGIVALALGPKVARYTATDQDYVLKVLRQNIAENLENVFPKSKSLNKSKIKQSSSPHADRIRIETLDWETDDVSHTPPVDLIIAADCIYNESLIEPLNSTCAAMCELRAKEERPTLCLIAQQLRSPDVFEAWLKNFHEKFVVWQIPDDMLGEGLKEGGGFVVHLGVVR